MAFQRIFIVVIVLSIFFLPIFEVILAFQIEGMFLYLSVPVQITYSRTKHCLQEMTDNCPKNNVI
jgi:hypothetical protein